MKFQRLKDMIFGAVVASMVLGSGTVAFAKVANMNIPVSFSNIKIMIDGKQLNTSKEPFTYNGTTYLPVRAVAEAVGKDVTWDGATKTVYLGEVPEKTNPNLGESGYLSKLDVKEYAIEKYGNCYYYLVVTNNSSDTLSISGNVVAKDKSGKTYGAQSDSKSAIASGSTTALEFIFEEEPYSAEYSLKAEKENTFKDMTKDIDCTATKSGDKLIVSCTNKSDKDCDSTRVAVMFFKNGKAVDYNYAYFGSSGFGLDAGTTIVQEISSDKEFDKYELYVSADRW